MAVSSSTTLRASFFLTDLLVFTVVREQLAQLDEHIARLEAEATQLDEENAQVAAERNKLKAEIDGLTAERVSCRISAPSQYPVGS